MRDRQPFDEQQVYEIRVKGVLDERWSGWFDGFSVVPLACGETLMAGPVADQAALHGLLSKIRDLGLPLLALYRVGDDHARMAAPVPPQNDV
jgi:hypothetical protein